MSEHDLATNIALFIFFFLSILVFFALFLPTLLYFAIGITLCFAAGVLAISMPDGIWSLEVFSTSFGNIHVVLSIIFCFGLLLFSIGSVVNGLDKHNSHWTASRNKKALSMSNPSSPSDPEKGREAIADVIREHIKLVVDPLAGSQCNGPPASTFMRFVAAAAGAFAFHAAIGLYPYLFNGGKILRDFSVINFSLSAAVSAFWVFFSATLYLKYDKNANFSNIFRSAFLFNVLIYVTGKLAHLVISSFVSAVNQSG